MWFMYGHSSCLLKNQKADYPLGVLRYKQSAYENYDIDLAINFALGVGRFAAGHSIPLVLLARLHQEKGSHSSCSTLDRYPRLVNQPKGIVFPWSLWQDCPWKEKAVSAALPCIILRAGESTGGHSISLRLLVRLSQEKGSRTDNPAPGHGSSWRSARGHSIPLRIEVRPPPGWGRAVSVAPPRIMVQG